MIKHAELVNIVAEESGLRGNELELTVHIISAAFAEALGNKPIAAYYDARANEVRGKIKKKK